MPRYWGDIKLPSGVFVYEGKLKTTVKLIFKDLLDKKYEITYENADFNEIEINEKLIQAAADDLRKIKKEIKAKTFIFEAWFPQSQSKLIRLNANKTPQLKFKDFIFTYYELLVPNGINKELSASTIPGYYSYAKNEFCNYFGNFKMVEISGDLIDKWVRAEIKKGNKPHTIKNKISILNKIFLCAKLENIIKINPIVMSNIDGFKNLWQSDKLKPQAFDAKILNLIFSKMTNYEQLIFSLWRLTGIRSSELCVARKRQFDGKRLYINRAQVRGVNGFERNQQGQIINTIKANIEKITKTQAGKRFINLTAKAINILIKLNNFKPYCDSEFIFVNPNTMKNFQNEQEIRNFWYKICDRVTDSVDLERLEKIKLNPYKFRHTYCVERFEDKQDPIYIKSNMGHANISQTFNYAEPASEFDKNS